MQDEVLKILLPLIEKFPIVTAVLAGLGMLVFLAQGVVLMTKTKKDDEILQKVEGSAIGKAVLDIVKSFAPWQKKPEGGLVSSAKAVK